MIEKIRYEINKMIIGHNELIDSMLIGLLSEGHVFIEGVPGVAKTTAVKSLADSLGFNFKRIQFTPDLLPSDIVGSEILDIKNNDFKIKFGPVFTNLLLADEINRAGAKVQSALLEAMAERQVSIADETFRLQEPFMVLATANPVDQDGTYELPEASLDRFMLKVLVSYNTIDEEFDIVMRIANSSFETINKIASKSELEDLKQSVKDIHVDDELLKYMLNIIFCTREPEKYNLDDISQYIDFGASPRASIDLYKASKAHALISGRDFVTPFDISKMAYPVLRHRLMLNYNATAQNIDADDVIKTILEAVSAP